MTPNPSKRVALVTGGTRGIGKAISLHLQNQGCTVVANYHGNDQAAQELKKTHGISSYKWDVSDYQACTDYVARIQEDHGPIDILVNNAGVTRDSMFHKMSPEQWHQVLNINLSSCFNMARCVIEGMRARQFGRIIMISSINGQKGQLGQVNYSAAKAGLLGFAKALALENAAKGITVNVITPGYIETEMVGAIPDAVKEKIINQIPMGRLGQPEEIARTVGFLACETAGFITGSTFSVNGGHYMA